MKKYFGNGIILLFLLLLILGVTGVIYLKSNKENEGDIIVKDNVYAITGETELEKQPSIVNENSLIFRENPNYKNDDIIVAGIINGAQNGFIRRVVKTTKKDNEYIVETEPAVLTDVFEKLHIVKTFRLMENGLDEVSYDDIRQGKIEEKIQKISYNKEQSVNRHPIVYLSNNKTKDDIEKNKSILSDDDDNEDDKKKDSSSGNINIGNSEDYLFGVSFEETIGDVASIVGETGFSIWVKSQLDIDDGDIVYGVTVHNKFGGKIELNCGGEMPKEVERSIYKKGLPNSQFVVAGIPIVVTNEIEATVGAGAEIEGSIGIAYEAISENTYGFLYDSKKGRVEEIKENESDSDGLQWTTAQVSGESTANMAVHLITKLYGSTGADISVGVVGGVSGEATSSISPELAGYAGRLTLSISPKVEGTLVVSVPVIDKQLTEHPLFRTELKPFWEKEWKSSHEWKADLERAGMGEKARNYITRYGEINGVICPVFQFDFLPNWKITTEEVGNTLDFIGENIVLSNDRGVTVSYWNCRGTLGGASRMMAKANITKSADSEFIPGYASGTNTDFSYLGKFMVAKVKVIGELYMDKDSDYTAIDGETFYAVVPESYLGEYEFVKQVGNIDAFTFEYPRPYAFIAESPDGTFTKREEKEVIEILKSFKIAEEVQRKTEEGRTKTHYENEYFSVDVPADWVGSWSVDEQDDSSGVTMYTFGYDPTNGYPGSAVVCVLDMSDTGISSETHAAIVSSYDRIGVTSSGYYDVFKTEAGAGFFDYGATITLK